MDVSKDVAMALGDVFERVRTFWADNTTPEPRREEVYDNTGYMYRNTVATTNSADIEPNYFHEGYLAITGGTKPPGPSRGWGTSFFPAPSVGGYGYIGGNPEKTWEEIVSQWGKVGKKEDERDLKMMAENALDMIFSDIFTDEQRGVLMDIMGDFLFEQVMPDE